MSPRYDVFLSHATADKPAVEYLAHKLRAVGIEPFLDKWHLIPGRIWQTELSNGLRNSTACAIFVGSEGFGPWHTQEMLVALDRGARDLGFPVIPVLLPGFRKPSEIPELLAQRTWVEFSKLEDEDAFYRLLCGIRGEIPDLGLSGGGPVKPPRPSSYRSMAQVPEEFVPRREYDKVLEALCPKDGAVQSGMSIGITTALRGAGGFGKTALAQQLCQDERIRERYPDGILWTTMGEEIDANGRLSRIRDLIRWWTNKEAPAFETVTAAGAKLREFLNSNRVLIVIDDVWSPTDIAPFQGLGNGSALLITTRDSQTLQAGSKRIEVDSMASAEAVSLLRSGLPDEQEEEFISLATQLGEWPLLLKMVNRQLRELVNNERRSIHAALKEINEALDLEGFSAFDRDDPESRHAAASRTIFASIRRFQQKEFEWYFQLAVFPEDVQIPISVLERFWKFGSFQVRKFCRRLYDLSLLLEFNVELEAVRLHDVVRRVLIEQIGDDLPTLHRHLLDIFKPASGSWSDLPVEKRYLWQNMADHLIGAERKDELKELLTDLSFLQAKLNAVDVNALMADYQALIAERDLRLIRDALRLSAHVLTRDRQQLASQLLGRLLGFQGNDIEKILESAKNQMLLILRQGSLVPAGGPLLRTLEGHSGWVNAVALVSGLQAVSGSTDGTLRVWDLESGDTIRQFDGHTGWVNTVALVDSHRVVSGSTNGTLQVRDLVTGDILCTLKGHLDKVNAVAVLDSYRIISGSADRTLRVWDLVTGDTLRTLEGHSNHVTSVAVLDSRRAVSGSADETLRVWDVETGVTLQTLKGREYWDRVTAVVVFGSHWAVSGYANGILRVWDLETGTMLRTLKRHSDRVTALAMLDSHRVVSGSADGTLRVWDLKIGNTLRILEGHLNGITSVSLLGSRRAISGSVDRTLRVWDLEASSTLREIKGHSEETITAMSVLDDRRAISGSYDRVLKVWDLETGGILNILKGHLGKVTALSALDNRRVLSGSTDRTLRIWDLETDSTIRLLEGHTDQINAVSVWNGRRIVSGSADKTLRVWDLDAGSSYIVEGNRIEGHSGSVTAVAVIDWYRAVSGSADRTLRMWDLETGETLCTLRGHYGKVTALVALCGNRVISSSDDRTLRLWDLETGETLHIFQGHSGKITGVIAWGTRRAVSASEDRTLRVWDLESGETLAITTLEAPILEMGLTPNGRILIVGDQRGKWHLLDLAKIE